MTAVPEVVHSYSRAEAIADGVLVDLMRDDMLSVCKQHYKHPIACTSAVFEIMKTAVDNPRYCNDFAGVLHDMLYMSKVVGYQLDPSTVQFKVMIVGAGRMRYHTFKLCVSLGDNAEPVITILLPTES